MTKNQIIALYFIGTFLIGLIVGGISINSSITHKEITTTHEISIIAEKKKCDEAGGKFFLNYVGYFDDLNPMHIVCLAPQAPDIFNLTI